LLTLATARARGSRSLHPRRQDGATHERRSDGDSVRRPRSTLLMPATNNQRFDELDLIACFGDWCVGYDVQLLATQTLCELKHGRAKVLTELLHATLKLSVVRNKSGHPLLSPSPRAWSPVVDARARLRTNARRCAAARGGRR
jgi:hypothetical protein